MKNTKRDDFWAAKAEIVSQFLAGADDVSTMIAPLLATAEVADERKPCRIPEHEPL